MADDPNRIDPRYDPAFQRGFRGDVRAQPRADSALRRAPVAPAPERAPATPEAWAGSVETVGGPVPEAVPVPTAAEPVGASGAAPASAPVPAPESAGLAIAAEPASVSEVTRNPFYLAAAALAVLLIVGGAVWLDQGFAAIADGRAASDVGFYAASTMSVGAPLLIGIGILIVAGLLFVLARGWRPRDDR